MIPGVDASDLDAAQRARVEALNDAKRLLSEYKHPASPDDLSRLAAFILNGDLTVVVPDFD